MIKQSEIQKISGITGLKRDTIDKDWVLGHMLNAIVSMPELKNIMVFKGGTCLKKCYFPDYRFSEDLDFTITDNSFVFNEKYVTKIIQKATAISFTDEYNRGILFKLKVIEPTKSKDIDQGFKVYLHYWGADHSKNDMPSEKIEQWHHTIKLDINHTEEIIFPIKSMQVNHNYSDNIKFENCQVQCYSIEEILSEKLRSLIQRKYTSPRDCYDIWYLKNNNPELNWSEIKNAFFKKSKNKNIEFIGTDQLLNLRKEKILKQHWQTQLNNQFPTGKLPDYSTVINELKYFFTELF